MYLINHVNAVPLPTGRLVSSWTDSSPPEE